MDGFTTVAGPSRYAMEPVKGSRFVATIDRARDEAEALALVERVRRELPDATHHTWAFRLRDGRGRSHDAGEPGGSAGRPILARLEGRDLRELCVVVSRWFGGTKLGVGGLVRAYGGCAGKALDRAELVTEALTDEVEVTHAWSETAAVDAWLRAQGLTRLDPAWGEVVSFRVRLPRGVACPFAHTAVEPR